MLVIAEKEAALGVADGQIERIRFAFNLQAGTERLCLFAFGRDIQTLFSEARDETVKLRQIPRDMRQARQFAPIRFRAGHGRTVVAQRRQLILAIQRTPRFALAQKGVGHDPVPCRFAQGGRGQHQCRQHPRGTDMFADRFPHPTLF